MDKKKLIITPKPPKGEDGHSTFSIRIQSDLLGKIESIVRTTGHSRNELIGILLAYAVGNCEIEQDEQR